MPKSIAAIVGRNWVGIIYELMISNKNGRKAISFSRNSRCLKNTSSPLFYCNKIMPSKQVFKFYPSMYVCMCVRISDLEENLCTPCTSFIWCIHIIRVYWKRVYTWRVIKIFSHLKVIVQLLRCCIKVRLTASVSSIHMTTLRDICVLRSYK